MSGQQSKPIREVEVLQPEAPGSGAAPTVLEPDLVDDPISIEIARLEQAHGRLVPEHVVRTARRLGIHHLALWEDGLRQAQAPALMQAPLEESLARQGKAARQAILPRGKGPVEIEQCNLLAPMPTDLCRTRPFYPMSKEEMADRKLLRNELIHKSSFGTLTYTGPKLSTYEEDVLLALLALMDLGRRASEKEGLPAHTTYRYAGPALPLFKMMGVKKPSRADYKSLKERLKLLKLAVLELTTKKGKWSLSSIILHAAGESEKEDADAECAKYLDIVLDPYFLEMTKANNFSFINLQERFRVKGALTRALLTYLQSHTDMTYQGNFLTLTALLQMPLEKGEKYLRKQLQHAIKEGREEGLFTDDSGFSRKRGSALVKIVHVRAPSRKSAKAALSG
ncbi:hypothetical protein [Megalodesulfovibrio paquesii]